MMVKSWDFLDGITKDTLELDNQTKERYIALVKRAKEANPSPIQSGFFVRASAMTPSGKIVTGSNHEKGYNGGIAHAEELLIARSLDEYKESPETIAFDSENIYPCGSCRDALKSACDISNLTILNGSEDNRIYVTDASELYFEDFKKIESFSTAFKIAASNAAKRAYNPYSPDEEIYGAVIVTEPKNFTGAFDGDAAYHPIYPIQAAFINFKENSLTEEIKRVSVVSMHKKPDVPYKERQYLLEKIQALGIEDISVYLHQADKKRFVGSWKTSAREWLPHAFSPKDLGMEERIKTEMKKNFYFPR